MTKKMNELRLLEADEIECRVGRQGKTQHGAWCTLLLYKDARCDYRILDETFGVTGWQCKYETIKNSLYCTIEVWDSTKKQWVSKTNVGTESNTEAVKGEASDAFKRAAVALGIGRELYSAPKSLFVTLQPKDTDSKGRVKAEAFSVAEIGYDSRKRINKLVIVDMDGEVRYDMAKSKKPSMAQMKELEGKTLEQAVAEAKAESAQAAAQQQMAQTVETLHARQVTVEEAKAEILRATSKAQLKQIYDQYAYLQKNTEFVSALTERKGQVA